MNILVVSQYYYPEQFLINDIAPELVRRGHDVTVLTGLPNYPQGDLYEGYRHGEKRDEWINGVHVIRVKEHPRKQGLVHLLWNYCSFCLQGTRAAKRMKEKFDIVFVYQLSPVTMAVPGLKYAQKNRVPVFLYCLDIWPESAQAHVRSEKGLLYQCISLLSRKIYAKCTNIAVTSRLFMDYLHDKNGISADRMMHIPQHADAGYLGMDLSSCENGTADFMYAGNLGQGQVVETVVRAAERLKQRKDFRVHLVGDGSCRQSLEAMAKEKGLSDIVLFYGNQRREDMPDFYRNADALLITLRGNNFVGNTVPGKLQVYMTTGKPIFGAINGAAREIIGESACGAAVGAGDDEGLARLMEHYITRPEDYVACGENAKNYFAAHFTLNTYMDALESALTRTVKEYADKIGKIRHAV